MDTNDRALQFGSPPPYGGALPLAGNERPAWSYGDSTGISVFKPRDGYYSDGTKAVYIQNGIITSVGNCATDYVFESNKYKDGLTAYISCYHTQGLGTITSNVTVYYRITGVNSGAQTIKSLTINAGTSSNNVYHSLAGLGFLNSEAATFSFVNAIPPSDSSFNYKFPPT